MAITTCTPMLFSKPFVFNTSITSVLINCKFLVLATSVISLNGQKFCSYFLHGMFTFSNKHIERFLNSGVKRE
ncbi:Uncharacterised protein [Vibrio cholerae]|uniref:Uncharacterized protein n=1 Tax=Vibrio cholerae TaxID=666 RepID=A0A655PN70_VIBCL|nr:Uncharacterised protein [Vibrio cholerae]